MLQIMPDYVHRLGLAELLPMFIARKQRASNHTGTASQPMIRR
jgi:hypothetical protein